MRTADSHPLAPRFCELASLVPYVMVDTSDLFPKEERGRAKSPLPKLLLAVRPADEPGGSYGVVSAPTLQTGRPRRRRR